MTTTTTQHKRPRKRREGPGLGIVVRWSDMCRTMRMLGLMNDYSKGECLRIRKLLKERMKEGHVRQVGKGQYCRVLTGDDDSCRSRVAPNGRSQIR